ncbi:MAG: hypothetical protein WEB52_13745 [Dehalococcoidia bacterium]
MASQRSRRRAGSDGQRIASRKRIPAGTRFVADRGTGLVHDLSRERPYCGLEQAFSSGTAETFLRPLSKAKASGLRMDDVCIGARPSDTFDGTKTVLLQMYTPPRKADVGLDLNERLDFHLRLVVGFERNRDRALMHERLARLRVPSVFYQAMRIPEGQEDGAAWGEPSTTIALQPDFGAPADDVRADLFIPRSIEDDERSVDRFTGRVMAALFGVKTVKTAFAKHFARHGYRDLQVYGHLCDTVDDRILPRAHADCSQDTGGSGGGGGGGQNCY